jgi:dTDP-4-amino-4,6-dideoxygalactose transaminase
VLKSVAKSIARATLGLLPPLAARLSGPLAMHGGAPVRDLRLRPFASAVNGDLAAWLTEVGPAFRRVFLSGIEGLPQPLAREFERRWADYCGCRHALMLPHGTDALRIGLAAAFDHDGLGYGGEVIVPNLSFIASATACLDRRFGVALVDVDPESLQLDPLRVEEAIIPGRTVAMMPVHQFGQPADMTSLLAIAGRHGLKVIEDAAQAHGAEWETGMVGALGDAGAFSFQSSKTLASGEGGILTTNDDDLIARARSIYNAGRAPDGGGRWEHPGLGWNCRPAEYQAALLLHRLAGFDAQQRRRAENFAILDEQMRQAASLKRLALHPGVRRHGMYMYAMRYRPELCGNATITQFLEAVQAEGAPIHRLYVATISGQPAFQKLLQQRPEYIRVLPTPVADEAIANIVYISHSIFLGAAADMKDIAAAVRKVEAQLCIGRK